MEPTRFDHLVRSFAAPDSRRTLLRLLAALPVAGGLRARLDPEGAQGQGIGDIVGGGRRRRRRKRRHDHGDDKKHRKRKRKGRHPGKEPGTPPPTPGCTPTTCAAQGKNCGAIADGCGGQLRCGPDACGAGFTCTANVCRCGDGTAVCGGVCCQELEQVCKDASGPCCTPTTCAAQGKDCGTIADGCGRTIRCGPDTCAQPADPCQEATCTDNVCVTGAGHDGASCGSASCTNGTATPAGSCSGGACPPGTPVSCTPYTRCDGAVCATRCEIDDDCVGTAFCNAAHQCAGDHGNGQPCAHGGQCQSGSCVDGVCCDGACSDACHACNLPGHLGACTAEADGTGCGGSNVCCGGTCRECCGTSGCTPPETCGGGNPGTPGVCGCTDSTCPAGADCGSVTNVCGGTVGCGPDACGNGFTCTGNRCLCPNGKVTCQGVCCQTGEVCRNGNGACCTRQGREAACAGRACGPATDSCTGEVYACGPAGDDCATRGFTCTAAGQCQCPAPRRICPTSGPSPTCCQSGQVCANGTGACCTNSTCPLGANCGTIDNVCGGTITCGGSCGGTTPICSGNICIGCSGDTPCPDGLCCTASGACNPVCPDGTPKAGECARRSGTGACIDNDQCCSGVCKTNVGCCPTCPSGCTCNVVIGSPNVACTSSGGSGATCGPTVGCPAGEACVVTGSAGQCRPVCTGVG